ncbi:MAG: signal recognition particle-docking protein FtsY [Candidatus Hermodarchaeota archaeon]
MSGNLRRGMGRFFEKISTYELTEKNMATAVDELGVVLLKNNVAYTVVEEIKRKIIKIMTGEKVRRLSNKKAALRTTLKIVLERILKPNEELRIEDYLKRKIDEKSLPLTIAFLGVNGTGKTTTIAKVAFRLLKQNYRVVLAASDTFRSGAQEQIAIHAKNLNVPLIAGRYGSDPSAVAFDAIQHAIARKAHAVLIDTAGRMTTNVNLIMEVQKLVRVTNPDLVILVGDALAGQDAVNQAKEFNEKIGIDGMILTKTDADEKGGTALSLTHTTGGKPICYIGTGQKYQDLEEFNPKKYVDMLLKGT